MKNTADSVAHIELNYRFKTVTVRFYEFNQIWYNKNI